MRSHRPGVFATAIAGAATGLMFTAALTAVSYCLWQLAGLPFFAYDLFDWAGRILPGQLVTVGIDTMVPVIRALHIGPTSVVAKAAEHALAIVNVLFLGTLAGAALWAILRALDGRGDRRALPAGLLLGLAAGACMLAVSLGVGNTARVSPAVTVVWLLPTFLVWGWCLAWAYMRWSGSAIASDAAEEEPSRASSEQIHIEQIDRRRFLIRLGGATATITVAGAILGRLGEQHRQLASAAGARRRWSSDHPLPNADATVQPAPGTRPEFTPLEQHYRIDINTTPPTVDGDRWRLSVGGLVEHPLSLTLDDLRHYPPQHLFVTLACISNPVGGDLTSTTRWTGVSLKRLLSDLHLKSSATHLKIRSADGFFEVLPLNIANADERVMLAYAWDGLPLSADHGFPLRIYIPDHYGMKQPKWIQSIEATDHWEEGYWVVRGWDKEARMKATSVIDVVAMNMMVIEPNTKTVVPIGGIAHAGARGISRVQVRVNDGPWENAMLRKPLSGLTWVIWRYDWTFQPGQHTFTVRCYDVSGTAQIETMASVRPSGASGLHSKTQML